MILFEITEKLYIGFCPLAQAPETLINSYGIRAPGASLVLIKVTLDGLPHGSCMGAAHQKDQAMIRSLESSAPLPYPPERGEELEMESITNHS